MVNSSPDALSWNPQIVSFQRPSAAACCVLGPVGWVHLRCCRSSWVCVWQGNQFDGRDPWVLSHVVWCDQRIWYKEITFQFHGLLPSDEAVNFHQSRSHDSRSLSGDVCVAKIWTQFEFLWYFCVRDHVNVLYKYSIWWHIFIFSLSADKLIYIVILHKTLYYRSWTK